MKLKDVLIASVIALAVTTSASAAPSLTLRYGRTDVALDSGFLSALESLQVTTSPLKPSLIRKGVIVFPIPVGRLDQENLKGEILHTGGLVTL